MVILAIAAFFRLWKLDSIPPGLYPDVALNGNETLQSLKTHDFKVFYPENNGREGIMMWLIALSFSIFGVSIWSIKIVSAAIGILTVFGLYLLTKEILQNTRYKIQDTRYIALLSGFFLAVSFWHTNFSRIGFRAILLPFILVFSFYFLFRGFNTKRIWNFIVSGIIFGLGFYTYTSFRVTPLILFAVLIPYWLIYKKQNLHPVRNKPPQAAAAVPSAGRISNGVKKQFLFSVSYFLLSIFIIALPIGIYFLQHPQDFISRATGVSIFSQENPIKSFAISLIKHLGMFNFHGDTNWRHNLSGQPMLDLLTGILFLIGIIFSIKKLIKSFKEKNYSAFAVYCTLIAWFFIMLLPGVLTYEGIPHALRTIGVIPVLYIFAGIAGWEMYDWFYKNTKKQKLLVFVSSFILFAIAFANLNEYFVKWGENPELKNAFSENYVKIGNYLNSLSQSIKKYVIVKVSGVPVPCPDGIPVAAQTVMFVENAKYGKPQSIYLLPQDIDKIGIKNDVVIVLMEDDEKLFNEIQQKFNSDSWITGPSPISQ